MATPNGQAPGKSFIQKLFQKKVLLILLICVVVLGLGGTLGIAGVEKASDKPAFCTNCHIMQPMYDSYSKGNLLAKSHAKAGVKCHDCHKSSLPTQINEGIKYFTGNYTSPLKTRQFSKEMCLECHNYNDVKAKTNFEDSNPHASHNGQLECFKCHKLHQPSTVYCSKCHTDFSWMSELPAYFNSNN